MGQSCNCSAKPRAEGPPKPQAPQRPRVENEPWTAFHLNAFQVSSAASSRPTRAEEKQGWLRVYSLGRLLGDGISAKVFEAEALADMPDSTEEAAIPEVPVPFSSCGAVSAAMPHCLREHGRKVAIKRFHRLGSRTFMKELNALKRVGTHPNVLRLLESYQGFNGEDVLVLEYCNGSTLYDLYAREHPKGGLPERLVARLLRQLCMALEHLASCGVEHQDVKPENMMLFDVTVSAFQAELKLGDFGWAAIAPPPGEGKLQKPPPTGAGSLWYAPPELNPPVEGIEPEPPAVDLHGEPIKGLSDMWSAGVVLYLLLVGHNPFNQALKQPHQEAQDQEVLRLVAIGNYNRRTERWLQLHPDARDLIAKLLRVQPGQRCSATDALRHPFVTKRTVAGRVAGYGGQSSAISTCMDGEHSVFFHGSVAPWAGRERRWHRLDGFQRLAWLAMARAVAEPEIDRAVVQGAMEGMEHERQRQLKHGGDLREAGYLWQLARELGCAPIFQWLQDRSAWPDAVRLAFGFLDADGDGVLSLSDLLCHFAGAPVLQGTPMAVAKASPVPSAELAKSWIQRWQVKDKELPGLPLAAFREALLGSCGEDALFGALEDEDDGLVADTEMEGPERAVGARGAEQLQTWGGDGTGGTGGEKRGALSFPGREDRAEMVRRFESGCRWLTSYVRSASKSVLVTRSCGCLQGLRACFWDRTDSEEERQRFEQSVAFLRSVPLFRRQLPSCELPKLARDLRRKVWRPGDKIVHQGEVGRAFYLIQSGIASVIVTDCDGKEHVRASLIAGDYFGGHTLVAERENVGTVVSQGPELLVTLSMSRKVFEESGLKDKLFFPKRPALYIDPVPGKREPSAEVLSGSEKTPQEQAFLLAALKHNVNLRALHNVSNEVMQSIAAAAVPTFVPKGRVVAQSGTLGQEFFVVKTGKFHAIVEAENFEGQKSAEATVAQLTMSERLKRKQDFMKSLSCRKGSNQYKANLHHSQSVRVPAPRGPKAMSEWADDVLAAFRERGHTASASPCSDCRASTPSSTAASRGDLFHMCTFQVGDKVKLQPGEVPWMVTGVLMASSRFLRGLALALLACCALSALDAFVAPRLATNRQMRGGVQMQAGEYTGFVPDMQRRQLMNFVLVTTAGIPVLVALGCYLWYFVPPVASGGGGAQLCGDLDGNPVTLESWVKGHKDNDRELVQGLKGEPYYLISTPDNIKDFALLSVCTHLGCVVPWSKAANKFCCPCHGSQYDENGKVVRGPAPLSLALAHTTTVKGNLALSPWTEQDFRTNVDPWWK
ncbi:unnamed protein product [Effrenium voratum]|uniref:cGMP-dependent protein kinase n=1 Tax=Effrenium voratum TaxID=2562239 RepID=A0AA36MK52_9DINO|nr:unnamed protein product [Effrenium voratum]